MFGASVFEKYVYLDTGADKYDGLSEYRDRQCVWIEDKPENALVGYNLKLSSILVEHGHNMHYDHTDIPRVKNWKEIYNIILADY